MPPAPGTSSGIGLSPVKPMNWPVCAISSAHSPKPWASNRSSSRSIMVSLAARSRVAGKNRMVCGSALSAAKGSRSPSCHRRITSRPVRKLSNLRAGIIMCVLQLAMARPCA
jgi:hypothetical protein